MKIGIITLYRGYNYGTSLQAYALKKFISSLGYQAQIVWTAQGANRGRDIRLDKVLHILWRCLFHPSLIRHTFWAYATNLSKNLTPQIKKKFLDFTQQKLAVLPLSKHQLRAFAAAPDTAGMICGSDQIWKSNAAYVESLYFLRFAPAYKRIAYAPSFGGDKVPAYNRPILTQYISDIPYVSVREDSGKQIVQELTGRDVLVLPDPTLLLDWDEFMVNAAAQGNYLLAYFLDTPSQAALESLRCISQQYGWRILAFPYRYKAYTTFKNLQYIEPGPEAFVGLIKRAKCVLTDSFHGTIFAINLQIPFWTFERNYATGKGQSSRLTSVLNRLNLQTHYITQPDEKTHQIPTDTAALKTAKKWILAQRKISKQFLQNALSSIGEMNAE